MSVCVVVVVVVVVVAAAVLDRLLCHSSSPCGMVPHVHIYTADDEGVLRPPDNGFDV